MDYDEALKPYALGIGYLTIEWNLIHVQLAWMLSKIVSGEIDGPCYYIWDSTPSDRAQREMLRAVIKTNDLRPKERQLSPELVTEIDWLLKEVDVLAEQRNNALHAIYYTLGPAHRVEVILVPAASKRTKNMVAKGEVIAELAYYREKAMLLNEFVGELSAYSISKTLPSRPSLAKP